MLGNQGKSLVVSPFSLASCLELAQAGALGSTAEQLHTLLAGNPNGTTELIIHINLDQI